jgi:pimeloyl-ACP methyl ester carboxylesterase
MARSLPPIVFVHGLGQGQGSPLEEALRHAAKRWAAPFHVLRWDCGPTARIGASAVLGGLAALLGGVSPSFADVIEGAALAARRHFALAEAGVTEAVRRCRVLIAQFGEPVALLGFSLGTEVCVQAVRGAPALASAVRRVVLAGGTAPVTDVRALRDVLPEPDRLVNVWSSSDLTLPAVAEWRHRVCCGLSAVSGVASPHAAIPHGGYTALAGVLVEAAVCGEILGRPVRVSPRRPGKK